MSSASLTGYKPASLIDCCSQNSFLGEKIANSSKNLCWFSTLVYILIHSQAKSLFSEPAGIAKSQAERRVIPVFSLGIVARAHFPTICDFSGLSPFNVIPREGHVSQIAALPSRNALMDSSTPHERLAGSIEL